MSNKINEWKVRSFLPNLARNPSIKNENEALFNGLVQATRTFRQPKHKRKGLHSKLPRKKKSKVTRCSSPSHFHTDEEELNKYGPEFMRKIPFKKQIDSVLRAVSDIYYVKRKVESGHVIHTGYQDSYKTLDLIKSPIRKPSILDNWTMREIVLFESGFIYQGKNFYQIAKLIGSKSTKEVIEFYYHWKHSAHYQMFKYHGRPWTTNRKQECDRRVANWDNTNDAMSEIDPKEAEKLKLQKEKKEAEAAAAAAEAED